MFTGIIESTARLRSQGNHEMWLDVPFAGELSIGQSVACDGVCLTVVEKDEKGFRVELLEETKRLTRFGGLHEGAFVNVERAMKVGDRLDGHVVQAHCEGLGLIKNIVQENVQDLQTFVVTVKIPRELMKYMISKGIIVLNGIALTITSVDDESSEIQVAIIPHTWQETNLQSVKEGDEVHVETDVFARYYERMTSDQ